MVRWMDICQASLRQSRPTRIRSRCCIYTQFHLEQTLLLKDSSTSLRPVPYPQNGDEDGVIRKNISRSFQTTGEVPHSGIWSGLETLRRG